MPPDPKKMIMATDLDSLSKDMTTLYNRVDTCMDKVDLGNDIARDTQAKLAETNYKVEKVLNVLQGNDLDDEDAGLIGDYRVLKSRIDKLEKRIDRYVYIIIGFAFGTGYAISDIISKMFTK